MCISKKKSPPTPPPPPQPTCPTAQRSSVVMRKRRKSEKPEEPVEPLEPSTQEQKEKRKQIEGFSERILSKGIMNLRTEFPCSHRGDPTNFDKMPSFQAAEKTGRNRYKDIGCVEETRVKLDEPWPHDYIHANYVATPSNPKRFICTQAPLEKTCADFWFMCLQEKVEVIFMVCNISEKGWKKCYLYYPTEKEKEKPLEFMEGEKKVTVKLEETKKFKFKEKNTRNEIIESVFSVEGPDGSSLKITHYHFLYWLDRGIPAVDMAILEVLEVARASKNPIVIQGSAGVGRSGSVIMIEYMMDQFLAGKDIEESDKILVKIREQRCKAVQTDLQYLFVHEVMLNYFEKKRYMSAELKPGHEQFKRDYHKVCGSWH